MEYQVPQFIEVESKIVGPLTLRQFIYLAGGGGACVAAFFYLPLIPALLVSALFGGLAVALSFYKVNGKPFIEIMEAGFTYYTGSKLFLWKRDEAKAQKEAVAAQKAAAAPPPPPRAAPRLSRGKLSELAWSLDIQEHSEKPEAAEPPKPQ